MRGVFRVAALTLGLTLVVSASAHALTVNDLVNPGLRAFAASQTQDGVFPDPLFGGLAYGRAGGYSAAMMGAALLSEGAKIQDEQLISAGLRAIQWVLAQPAQQPESVLENLAMAEGYNVAQASLAARPDVQALLPMWQAWLGNIRPLYLTRNRLSYSGNKYLIEALVVMDLDRSGLTSSVPGSILSDIDVYHTRAAQMVNQALPAAVKQAMSPDGQTAILSDPPFNPLAYHALVSALVTRIVSMLGPEATGSARKALASLVRGTHALAGPDGDVSYVGRSQEQSWTSAAVAYADAVSPLLLRQSHPASGSASLTLAEFNRLQQRYFTESGLAIVPAFQTAPPTPASVDGYASTVGYAGLTAVILSWVPDGARPVAATPRQGSWVLSRGLSTLGIVRKGRVWLAVHGRFAESVSAGAGEARSPAGDMRYDFGLMAFKQFNGAAWQDVLRIPPITHGTRDSSGPVLLRGAQRLLPDGDHLVAHGTKGLTMTVVWGKTQRPLSYKPLRNGVQITWTAKAGERFEYSLFRPAGPNVTPNLQGSTWNDGGITATASTALSAAVDGTTYASGIDAALQRVRLIMTARHTGPVWLRLTH